MDDQFGNKKNLFAKSEAGFLAAHEINNRLPDRLQARIVVQFVVCGYYP
jgi:hypothetical protein